MKISVGLCKTGPGCKIDSPDKDEERRQHASSQQDLGPPDLLFRILDPFLSRPKLGLCPHPGGRLASPAPPGLPDRLLRVDPYVRVGRLGRDDPRVRARVDPLLIIVGGLVLPSPQGLGPPLEQLDLFRARAVGPEPPDEGAEDEHEGEHDDQLEDDSAELLERNESRISS